MRRVGRNGAFALFALLMAAGLGLNARGDDTRARRAAIVAFQRAKQAALEGRAQDQLTLLLASFQADPTYVVALAELRAHPAFYVVWERYEPEITRAIRRIDDPQVANCVDRALWSAVQGMSRGFMRSPVHAAGDCSLFSALLDWPGPRDTVRRVEDALELWRKYPESPALANLVGAMIDRARDWERAEPVARQFLKSRDPQLRVLGLGWQILAVQRAGAESRAAVLEAAATEELRSKPFALQYAYAVIVHQGRGVPVAAMMRHGDALARHPMLRTAATQAYDDGDLVTSERLWNYLLRTYPEYPAITAEALMFRGRTHLKAGRLAEAERDLLAARGPARPVGDGGVLIQIEHNLFHVFEARGDRERALGAGQAYLDLARGYEFSTQRMMAFHDLGWYHWHLGEYDRARGLLGGMLALIDTIQTLRHFAGEYYERMGDLDRALHFYELAATIDRLDYRSEARRAVLAAQMGDTVQAIRLAELHDHARGPRYPEFTPQLPGILAGFGMIDRALAEAERATARARGRNQAAAIANLLVERAALELTRGRARAAEVLADSAIVLARQVAALEVEAVARGTRALAAFTITARANQLDTLRMLARTAAARRLPQLELVLQRLLARALAATPDLAGALAAYARAAQATDAIAASLSNDADRARFRGARNDVSSEALRLILRSEDPRASRLYAEWSMRRKARGLTGEGVAQVPAPGSGEAVIDYVLADSVVAVLVITPRDTLLQVLPVHASKLAEQIAQLRASLAPRLGSLIELDRSRFDTELAHALYTELIRPLLPALNGIERLVIVADGALHYLPFDALVSSPDPRAGQYLVRRFTIRYAPSLDLVRAPPPAPSGTIVAFTGNAVAADAEMKAIAGSLGQRLSMNAATGTASTENRVRQEGSEAHVVHFATHAAPNDVAPRFAYLALRPDGADDGRLHAFEIEKLRFDRALVVLSGCDTGGGRIAGGQGVLSLSRVFLRAGASATVATLWPVGAGTPAFMASFYEQLSSGVPVADALRQAKLRALDGPWASPLYWAPFVLISS